MPNRASVESSQTSEVRYWLKILTRRNVLSTEIYKLETLYIRFQEKNYQYKSIIYHKCFAVFSRKPVMR